jgi:glycosyltransferase involved in cell wall biosynthesis
MTSRLHVLFVGHEASRTGAPLLLREVIRWALTRGDMTGRCVLMNGGSLAPEFESLCETHVLQDREKPARWKRLFRKLGLLPSRNAALAKWLNPSQSPDARAADVIYVNSVGSLQALAQIRPCLPDVPVVIHVHELTWVLRHFEKTHAVSDSLAGADKIIAASGAVRDALLNEFRLEPDRIELIYEFLCRGPVDGTHRSSYRGQIRARLGISASATVCLGMGTMEWRKATDLIPAIASRCAASGRDLHFIWIGRETRDCSIAQLTVEAERLGASRCVHLAGEVEDPAPYLSAADLFVLPSREDPYPLAMLEAASYGLPVVCFDQSGGAIEFVGSGECGIAVPHLDTNAMAGAIVELSSDVHRAAQLGTAARRKVLTLHSPESTIPKILDVLRAAAGRKSRTKE